MSWFSKLAKLAGVAAVPFTGGSSLLATGIGMAGDALGAVADRKAQHRGSQAEMELAQASDDALRRQQYVNEAAARQDERNARARVTAADVRDIRQRAADHGIRYGDVSAIARHYGVTPRAISFVLAGETWRA